MDRWKRKMDDEGREEASFREEGRKALVKKADTAE
jgi:hypothetical protein